MQNSKTFTRRRKVQLIIEDHFSEIFFMGFSFNIFISILLPNPNKNGNGMITMITLQEQKQLERLRHTYHKFIENYGSVSCSHTTSVKSLFNFLMCPHDVPETRNVLLTILAYNQPSSMRYILNWLKKDIYIFNHIIKGREHLNLL